MALVEAPDLFEDDLLYGEAGAVDASHSDSDSESPDDAQLSNLPTSPHSKGHMDISAANSASHQSSTLRVSFDEDHDGGMPTPSPPINVSVRPAYNRAMAASMPARPVSTRLGTSAPINIPHMNRWRVERGPDEPKEAATTFIPPHQLSKQDDFMFSFTGASPGAGLKRDRLRARNAILRSTGFIEPQVGLGGSAAAAGGEGDGDGDGEGSNDIGTPVAALPIRPAVHSSLTAALTTIGEC